MLYLPEDRPLAFPAFGRTTTIEASSGCTITGPADDHIPPIHYRMPIILEESAYNAWLSGEAQGEETKRLLLDSELEGKLVFHQVS